MLLFAFFCYMNVLIYECVKFKWYFLISKTGVQIRGLWGVNPPKFEILPEIWSQFEYFLKFGPDESQCRI